MTDVPITPDTPIASDPGRRRRRGRGPSAVRHLGQGIGAVGVKELRGRMRGRRAFVILTIYLVLLAGFAWMVELIMERSFSSGFGGTAGTVFQSIYEGRPDGMPAWGGPIADDQIWRLVAYVQSLSKGHLVTTENFTGKTIARSGH
jgi:hypothetical protein